MLLPRVGFRILRGGVARSPAIACGERRECLRRDGITSVGRLLLGAESDSRHERWRCFSSSAVVLVIVTGGPGGSCNVAAVARPGDTIENPVTGERVTWIETAHSTGGELLAADLYVRPAAAVGLTHRHVRQEERFAVRSGTAGQDELRVRMELRPALDTETFLETFFGLARDGKTNAKAKGIPGLLQIAVLFRDLGDS